MKENKLVRRSHVIPDFMYEDLFDEHHQFIYASQESLRRGRFSRKSSGLYDQYLLCNICENQLLSSLESYAKIVLHGGPLFNKFQINCQTYRTNEGIIYTTCRNVDYTKFKLFLLSILWKASISKLDYFSEVSLGPHEQRIRKMLIYNEAGDDADYPVFMMGINRHSQKFRRIMVQPRKLKEGSRTLYLFTIQGILVLYNISKYNTPDILLKHGIRKNNQLQIVQLPAREIDSWFKKCYGVKNISSVFK